MPKPKNLNTRYILFTRYGERDCGNGQDKLARADSDTGRDKKSAEDEGRRESDVHDRRKCYCDEAAGGHELGRGNEAAGGSSEEVGLQAERSGGNHRTHEKREKKTVVADTNVLISATFWEGVSRRILLLAENSSVELITSVKILEEYSRALEYPEVAEKVKNRELPMVYNALKIAKIARITEPEIRVNVVSDPDDNKILECAIEGKADFVLTYDRHLLQLGSYEGIRIMTPDEFLEK
jgi:uncharacterized protein